MSTCVHLQTMKVLIEQVIEIYRERWEGREKEKYWVHNILENNTIF